MALYLIGLGLGDEKDITVKGLEIVRQCDEVFLEAYTSILPGIQLEKLEQFYQKKIQLADRELVEQGCESKFLHVVQQGKKVALLVVGDPFGATTHSDLVVRAKQLSIPVKIIHNASIMNAIGATGLQLYQFGYTVSIVFFEKNWRPDSCYDRIKMNRKNGLHTLCLLDIKVKEQSAENLVRNVKQYEPPRFMTVNQCISQLIELEQTRQENVYDPNKTMCIGCARLGNWENELIVAGTMNELLQVDFGTPLHSFIICAEQLHDLEKEFLHFSSVEYLKPPKVNTSSSSTQEEEEEEEEEFEVDAQDIKLVMSSVPGVSRDSAIAALRKHRGDIMLSIKLLKGQQ